MLTKPPYLKGGFSIFIKKNFLYLSNQIKYIDMQDNQIIPLYHPLISSILELSNRENEFYYLLNHSVINNRDDSTHFTAQLTSKNRVHSIGTPEWNYHTEKELAYSLELTTLISEQAITENFDTTVLDDPHRVLVMRSPDNDLLTIMESDDNIYITLILSGQY